MFLLALSITAGLQWLAGAFTADLAAQNPDEAPHVVNGLLIARYLATGLATPPIPFAAAFYQHYPKVSIGHWPPLFYVAEAGWMLVFSATRTSLMLMTASITALLAATVAAAGLRHGRAAAAGVACAFAVLPLVRDASAFVLVDVFVALLELWAALAFARYLARPSWRASAVFGLLAAAAILTKGNAVALALVPVPAVLLAGRAGLLRRPSFWVPVPVVLLLCGPWYAATYRLAADGFFYDWGLAYSRLAIAAYASFLLTALGAPALLLAVAGCVRCRDGRDAALVALVGGVLVCSVIIPADLQPRYLLPAIGPILLLALGGGVQALGLVPGRWRWPAGVAAGLACVVLVPGLGVLPHKPGLGMQAAARLAGPPVRAVLIAAAAPGEGAFVAEMALQAANSAPAPIIARGTKLLGAADFDGGHYRARFASADAMADAIRAAGVQRVLLDTSPGSLRIPHNRMLQTAAAGWPLLARLPHDGLPGATLVYEVTDPAAAITAACVWQPVPTPGKPFTRCDEIR